MGQHEGQPGLLAGIGEPVPVEGALGDDGQVVAIRLDALEEVLEVVAEDVGVDEFVALSIHEADVHLAGMEIDSAVELCGGRVILHLSSFSFYVMVLREQTPVKQLEREELFL